SGQTLPQRTSVQYVFRRYRTPAHTVPLQRIVQAVSIPDIGIVLVLKAFHDLSNGDADACESANDTRCAVDQASPVTEIASKKWCPSSPEQEDKTFRRVRGAG